MLRAGGRGDGPTERTIRGQADRRRAKTIAVPWPRPARGPISTLPVRIDWYRWAGPALLGSTVLILGVGLAVLVAGAVRTSDLGQDFVFYRDLGARWISAGSFYLDRQLHGPYELALMVDNLYPPTALVLFVPLAVLPAPVAVLVWWLIPLAILAYQLRRMSPGIWAWPLLALMIAWPRSGGAVIFGNTDLWVAAAVAAGTLWGWPALLLTLKPIFAPLAVVGANRGSWWIGVAGFAVVTIALLPQWLLYVEVIRDSGVGAAYSLGGVPLIIMPLVASLARKPDRGGSISVGRS